MCVAQTKQGLRHVQESTAQATIATRPASLHIQLGMTANGQLQLLACGVLTTCYFLAGLPSKQALELGQFTGRSVSAVAPKHSA